MKKAIRSLAPVLIFFFLSSILISCSAMNKLVNEVKKNGETVSVDKKDIGESIKTKKYGKFKFTDSQVKEIKKLKKKEQTYFLDVTAKKKSGGKSKKTDLVVLVVRVTTDRYQVFYMKKPSTIPKF